MNKKDRSSCLMDTHRLKLMLRPSLLLGALAIGLSQGGLAQEATPSAAPAASVRDSVTLFQNVRIFDGRSPALSASSNVLVRGNTIERISASPITVDRTTRSASLRQADEC